MADSFAHKKSLGQHFLTTPIVPGWMCDAAAVTEGDIILEVGPGTGVLTRELLNRGAIVIAIEADIRAIDRLTTDFDTEIKSKKLVISHEDVRNFKPDNSDQLLNGKYKVVANIPYYLSGFLFRLFLEAKTQPQTLVFLVQKEVAKRVTSSLATGKKESLLSLSAQAYGSPSYFKTVTRGHFTPPPKVDSGIVCIKDIGRHHFETVSQADFFTILHLGFGQKRKQLLGNLAKQYERDELINIFSTLNLAQTIRAEDVDLKTWLNLASHLTHTSSTSY